MQQQTFSEIPVIEWNTYGLHGASLLSMADVSPSQLGGVLDVAADLKARHRRREVGFRWGYPRALAMIFEKPSLRTRVTFELGMQQLGGLTTVLGPAEIGLGTRESVADVAANLERWADAIMARVYSHALLEELRESCGVPVINGLSDLEHPCQTVTDLLTMREKLGALHGLRLAWIGDGNNVLHSLLFGCALAGISVAAACPDGYHPRQEILARARSLAEPGVTLEVVKDPAEAARGAHVVYTDVWTSMGQEAEQLARIQAFRRYQVNAELMALADREAIFMHCLPAHRGDEVTNEVVDGPQSVVFDQAENRLHAQKALLALLIGP